MEALALPFYEKSADGVKLFRQYKSIVVPFSEPWFLRK